MNLRGVGLFIFLVIKWVEEICLGLVVGVLMFSFILELNVLCYRIWDFFVKFYDSIF